MIGHAIIAGIRGDHGDGEELRQPEDLLVGGAGGDTTADDDEWALGLCNGLNRPVDQLRVSRLAMHNPVALGWLDIGLDALVVDHIPW